MEEFAPAKINLFLDVIGKREDGYHDLGTLFQTINAGDKLSATFREDDKITLDYNVPQEYPKESDLVYKAALLMQDAYQVPFGAKLYLKKEMPLGAGLGGGSADGAATLRLLNRLWNLNLSFEALEELASSLGADVPFLIRGGSAFAEGIGEKLTFLNPLQLQNENCLLIATPLDSVPTRDAYATVPKSGEGRWENYKKGFLAAENKENFIEENLFNSFEKSVFPKHPLVQDIKEKMKIFGAKSVLMSGSGASVFGFFENEEKAQFALESLKSISRYLKITSFFEGFK